MYKNLTFLFYLYYSLSMISVFYTQQIMANSKKREEANNVKEDRNLSINSQNAVKSPIYGKSFINHDSKGISAGFHRWLGKAGTHYIDCIGAVLLHALDDPWAHNQFFVGAVFSTAVGQYGDPNSASIFSAASSAASEYTNSHRNYGGTAALPPLDYSYSSIATRVNYRFINDSIFSLGFYSDLGYGLIGTRESSQINFFTAFGSNLIFKIIPSFIVTLGLQYRVANSSKNPIKGFEEMSSLAIYNSFELIKF